MPGLDRRGIIWFLVAKLVFVVVGAVVHVRNLCVCFPSDCFCQTERNLPYAFSSALVAAALLCLAASQDSEDISIDPATFLLQVPGRNWIPAWAKLPPKASPTFDFAEALHKAFIYLRIQRSGNITAPDHHIAWRSDSCLACKGPMGEDLSGGYYEAGGSFLKVGLPEAFPVTQLAWTIVRHRTALYRVGLLDEALSALKWGSDYLLNCHNASANTFVALMGDSKADFKYYGPPELYERYVGSVRPVSYTGPTAPASEVSAEAAAALAAASLAFNATDPMYAANLVQHASQLFDLASLYPGSFMTSKDPGLKTHAKLYPSTGFHDELAWAAVWLFKATQDGTFLTAAMALFNESQTDGNSECCGYGTFSWDTKSPGVALLMAEIMPNELLYSEAIQKFCNWYIPPLRSVPHTANGLAFPYKGWGALRYASNAAAMTLFYAEMLMAQPSPSKNVTAYAAQLFNYPLVREHASSCHASRGQCVHVQGKSQIDFALGSTGQSYLVGFGKNSPKSPFQKNAWNSWLNYKPGTATEGQIRNDFLASPQPNRYTEPAIDYSSGLILALSALVNYHTGLGPYNECGLDFGYAFPGAPAPPNALVAACGLNSIAAGHRTVLNVSAVLPVGG
uniref:cellulase n=1 Tax=Glycine max TaxID=3847 RepID=A0A0R0EDN2_SOYBN